jgi:hypothetical protein
MAEKRRDESRRGRQEWCQCAGALQAQSGSLTIHMILHAIGEEHYQVASSDGVLTLNTTFEYSDRGNQRSTTATLRMEPDYAPLALEVKARANASNSIGIQNASATVQEDGVSRTFAPPERYFAVFGSSPFAVQAVMMRYWLAQGKPAQLPTLRAKPMSFTP